MKRYMLKGLRTYFRRRQIRRYFALSRAWQQIVESSDPDAISRLAGEIAMVPLHVPNWLFRLSGVPSNLEPDLERALRQTLLTHLYTHIMPGLLLLKTERPTALPVPAEWRAALRVRGVSVNSSACSLLLGKMAVIGLGRGALLFIRTLFFASTGRLARAPDFPYDVAVQLPASFLASSRSDANTVFVDWLSEQAHSGGFWVHGAAPVTAGHARAFVNAPLPDFPSLGSRVSFGVSAARLFLGAIFGLLLARPEPALLLSETVLVAHARSVGAARLARNYIFENSRWFLRPLFTRWAAIEAKSEAVLAFYSTNADECLRLLPSGRAPCFIPGYQSMDWDRYWVWDEYQAELLVAWGHERSKATIKGPIPLTDSEDRLPSIKVPSLAVFDVAPFSTTRLAAMGLVSEYYRDSIAAQFLDDLREEAEAAGITLVLKQKRTRKNIGPSAYEAAVRRLLEAPNTIVLDPEISAVRVTAACTATVSMPFSSPSLFAARDGRPAAFYDPTSRLIASQRQTHGLPIIHGSTALRQWLDALVSSQP